MRISSLILFLLLTGTTISWSQASDLSPVKKLMDEADIPGMSLATFKGENIQFFEYGFKDIKTLEAVERNTVFQAASLTKVIIATLCLQLYEEKKINLSAPLWRIVPYPKLEDDKRARKITARMVLSHTTGLPNWGGDQITLKNEPGTTFGYSGEAFVWLGLVMEKITGRSLQEMAQDRIFDPLEMKYSSLLWKEEYQKLAPLAYNEIEIEESYNKFQEVNAAASLWTTARDYAVFMQALLNGKILRWTSMTLMFNPRAIVEEGDNPIHWGYGIGIQFVGKRKLLWHWGDNRLFRCFVMAYPDTREGLVYFTNSENGLSILDDILQLYFPADYTLVKWLDYLDYKSEGLQARKELKSAFVYQDSTEGLKVYEKIHAYDQKVAAQFGSSTYWLLRNLGQVEKALPLLRRQLRDAPTDGQIWSRYADALARNHQYFSARQAYKRVIAADPDQYYVVKNKFRWLEEGIKAKKNKEKVPNLKDYTGQYHDIVITLGENELWVKDPDRKNPIRLIPINKNIFEVDEPVTFRYKFELSPEGAIEGVVIYDIDGVINYYPRK
jgi:CubicO group peptidase (beta-lactamase class C family)